MDGDISINPSSDLEEEVNPKTTNSKPKVVVIMGATGAGKSRLAIDLASHFPIEIINADSMQVYQGLDILTNKVAVQDQKGVPHHLLGTVSPDVEFTARNFRDYAIPLVNEITSRNHLPVVVGGTNYYIQSLVSQFLLDDSLEDADESCLSDMRGDNQQHVLEREDISYTYESLKELDPVAANRIHPNDYRKITQYLSLYARSGVLPSKFLQEKTMENWANADNFRFDCCFICVDASLPLLDEYVNQRVDNMVDAGLLGEVYDIFNPNAVYTRGLRQAIGVREFEDFLRIYLSDDRNDLENDVTGERHVQISSVNSDTMLKENMTAVLRSTDGNPLKLLLVDAIDKVKLNTRRLVRRQKRRLIRLHTLFGYNIHYVDSSPCFLDKSSGISDNLWKINVVEPAIQIIRSFFDKDTHPLPGLEAGNDTRRLKLIERDLWAQHVCEACGNKVLRGAYEWEQHKQGRSHRKRICRLRKSGIFGREGQAKVST